MALIAFAMWVILVKPKPLGGNHMKKITVFTLLLMLSSIGIAIAQVPGAATLISPSGATTTTPTYLWNAVSGSTWYYLWVKDITGNKIAQWYTATEAGCQSGTGTCSVTSTTAHSFAGTGYVSLAAGAGQWWIETFNSYGTGPWSSAMSFTAGGTVSSSVAVNPLQVALLRWYEANQAGNQFSAGSAPYGIAFDGANIWVANNAADTVTKLRASDGVNIGTFTVGQSPIGLAFDGANIWVAGGGTNTVTKLRASDGFNLGSFTFPAGSLPYKIAFDGANIWVVNFGSNDVTKLRASDGFNLGTFGVGAQPRGIAFDGANIWVTNFNSSSVTKLRASDGANLGTFTVSSGPYGIAFDGANIWVANGNSVTELRASDGANLGTFAVGSGAIGVAFDGANIWVTNSNSNSVSKL